jgi:hypothetical protein
VFYIENRYYASFFGSDISKHLKSPMEWYMVYRVKTMKRLSILALSAALAVTGACSRDLDDAPNAHKTVRYSDGITRVHPLPFNLSECAQSIDGDVQRIADESSDYNEYIRNLSLAAPELLQTENVLCSAKTKALEKSYKATFEADLLDELVSYTNAAFDMGKIYRGTDTLSYAVFLHEQAGTGTPHLVFGEPLQKMYDVMEQSIERDMADAINLAPYYLDFCRRIDRKDKLSLVDRTRLVSQGFSRVREAIVEKDAERAHDALTSARELSHRLEIASDNYDTAIIGLADAYGVDINEEDAWL